MSHSSLWRQVQKQIKVVVTSLHRANSFKELFSNTDIDGSFGSNSLDELLRSVNQHYSDSDQIENGVVGIEFALMSDK